MTDEDKIMLIQETINDWRDDIIETMKRVIQVPAIAPVNARIEPTDKSIPPVRITIVMPTDMHTFTEICRATLNRLSLVAKLSERTAIAIAISIKATSGCKTERSYLCFFMFCYFSQ